MPTWADLHRQLPAELRPYAIEHAWDRERLWSLDLPVEKMAVAELSWQLALPWWRDGDRYFSVRPLDVLERPDVYRDQLRRTFEADLMYPLDVTLRSGRWLVLDGVHRLLKAVLLGAETVRVRRVPAELLAGIAA